MKKHRIWQICHIAWLMALICGSINLHVKILCFSPQGNDRASGSKNTSIATLIVNGKRRTDVRGRIRANRSMGMHPTYRMIENVFEELDALESGIMMLQVTLFKHLIID